MELSADRVAEIAGRPAAKLTRRDVALALLRIPAPEALASLPTLRRGMVAAGNPLSAPFWDSAEAILAKIDGHEATVGDVQGWLESTGTEPTMIIGLHVWEDPAQRSPLQEEMHTRLVHHLEDLVADGSIDPDPLARAEASARKSYLELQEHWMMTPLADGRVPMHALLDEQDEQLIADWAAADAEALAALGAVTAAAGPRPKPARELHAAATALRAHIARPGWTGRMLVAFSGLERAALPAADDDLWLALATSVASPQGDPLSEQDKEFARALEWDEPDDDDGGDEPDELSAAMAAVCALDHFDWLAVMSALVSGGPGTAASAAHLARYVREYEPPGDDDDDGEFEDDEDDGPLDAGDYDEEAVEGMFAHVTQMWAILGAVDDRGRLTRLGWWGLPEAMRRAWSS